MVPHTKQDDSLQPGDQVYIKFVEFVAEEDFQPCFALPGLSHDTLAKVYEVGVYGDEDDDFQVGWIAMEALRPEPMFQLIQEMFRVEPDYVLTESDATRGVADKMQKLRLAQQRAWWAEKEARSYDKVFPRQERS